MVITCVALQLYVFHDVIKRLDSFLKVGYRKNESKSNKFKKINNNTNNPLNGLIIINTLKPMLNGI